MARRHDRNCDSSGGPNALSWASVNVSASAPRRSDVTETGKPPDAAAAGRARGYTRHRAERKANGRNVSEKAPGPDRPRRRRRTMILATTTVEDFDRFEKIFSTKGAEKRKQHGSKGATVYRDPNEEDRVWVLFDWNEEGWKSFVSDPEVPPIMQEAGHKGKPQAAVDGGQYDA